MKISAGTVLQYLNVSAFFEIKVLNVQKEELNVQVQGAGRASSLTCPHLGYPESKLEIFTCNASRDLNRLNRLHTGQVTRLQSITYGYTVRDVDDVDDVDL